VRCSLTQASVLRNLSQSYAYVISLFDGTTLCQVDADWILEDNAFTQGGQVFFDPFPTFSDTWFEGTYAVTANGSQIGIDGADVIYMSGTCTATEYDNSDFYMSST
jgi:Peptidase A4 family